MAQTYYYNFGPDLGGVQPIADENMFKLFGSYEI